MALIPLAARQAVARIPDILQLGFASFDLERLRFWISLPVAARSRPPTVAAARARALCGRPFPGPEVVAGHRDLALVACQCCPFVTPRKILFSFDVFTPPPPLTPELVLVKTCNRIGLRYSLTLKER